MLLLPPGRRDGVTGIKGDFSIFCGAPAKSFGALVKIANLVTRTYFSLVSFLNFRYLHFTHIFLLVISLHFHTHNCLRFGLFGFGSFKSRKKTNKLCTEAMKVFQVNGSSLSLALFTDVMNSKELLNLMQAGTLEPEVAFLNASLIPDVFPLLAAAHKTLLTKSRDSLTTRTLHSELVYNYSGSKHITESLKRCGISETCTYVLVAIFNASFDQMQAAEKLIKGNEIDLEELEIRANKPQIQKHYKITVPELGISSLADAIACRIAARDAL